MSPLALEEARREAYAPGALSDAMLRYLQVKLRFGLPSILPALVRPSIIAKWRKRWRRGSDSDSGSGSVSDSDSVGGGGVMNDPEEESEDHNG